MRAMTCNKARAWLGAAIDDEAGPAERAMVELHLEVCRACRQVSGAAHALRGGIAEALEGGAGDAARDEALVTILHREGVCHDDHREATRATETVRSGWFQRQIAAIPCRQLGPALTALSASFLVTLGVMRWAETAPNRGGGSAPAAYVAEPMADEESLERWLAETPAFAATLRPPPPPRPAPRKAPRRGAALTTPRRVG